MLDIYVLASLLLKPIFLYDVGHDVPTSWHGSVCPVCVVWFSQFYLFEETTSYFLFTK